MCIKGERAAKKSNEKSVLLLCIGLFVVTLLRLLFVFSLSFSGQDVLYLFLPFFAFKKIFDKLFLLLLSNGPSNPGMHVFLSGSSFFTCLLLSMQALLLESLYRFARLTKPVILAQ